MGYLAEEGIAEVYQNARKGSDVMNILSLDLKTIKAVAKENIPDGYSVVEDGSVRIGDLVFHADTCTFDQASILDTSFLVSTKYCVCRKTELIDPSKDAKIRMYVNCIDHTIAKIRELLA